MVDWRTDDRELLARILTAEAGNQGPIGMTAAGNVIMNRANTTGYGNGVRGVIMKPGQFSPMNSVTGYARGEQGQNIDAIRPNETAYTIADSLLSGTAKDITGGATHFYNPDISNPSWAKGKEFKRIGDHVFGSADAGRQIAAETMQVLGKKPRGILAPTQTSETESKPMMQEDKPRGLLGSLGIQKMQEGAAGETGQRFYERDTFKDTAATLAQGFAAMGSRPGLQKMAANIAAERSESKAKNKTVEFLRKSGREDLAAAVESGSLSARDAAGVLFSQPETQSPYSTIGKLQADLAAGRINQEQYDVALANMAPKGMRIVSDGRGGFTMEQGVGLGEDDGRMTPSDPSFMIKAIDDILADPALESSTGIMSPLQTVPGTQQYRFGTRARQLEGQAFLQAFESLKGAGQITEIEGQKATQAIGRLDTAQSAKDYRDALNDLKGVLKAAQERARSSSPTPSGVIEYDATGKRVVK